MTLVIFSWLFLVILIQAHLLTFFKSLHAASDRKTLYNWSAVQSYGVSGQPLSFKSLKPSFLSATTTSLESPQWDFFPSTRTSTIRWQVTPVSVSPLKDAPKPRPQKVNRRFFRKRRLEIPHLGLPDFLVRNVNELLNKRLPNLWKTLYYKIWKTYKDIFLLETYPCEIITSQKHVAFLSAQKFKKCTNHTVFLRGSLRYRLTDHLFWGKLAVVWTRILALPKSQLSGLTGFDHENPSLVLP